MSKKTNKEKYAFYYSVSEIEIILEKHEKNNKMTSSDVPTLGLNHSPYIDVAQVNPALSLCNHTPCLDRNCSFWAVLLI